MSQYVQVKGRDYLREANFKDAYGIDVEINVTNYNDEKWNWDMCVLKFKDSLGKNYGLIEYFKSGDDNSTDHVEFEYEDKDNEFINKRFDKFIEAELEMVRLMKKKLKGEN